MTNGAAIFKAARLPARVWLRPCSTPPPRRGRQIIGEFQPAMTKNAYLAFARGLFKKERYSGAIRLKAIRVD